MADTIYTVNVGGVDVSLYSAGTEAEITSVAKTANRRILRFEQGNKGAPKINSILLACLDFCEENRRLKEKSEKQCYKIASLKFQLAEAKKEVESLKAGK